jgi:hypothetical protein
MKMEKRRRTVEHFEWGIYQEKRQGVKIREKRGIVVMPALRLRSGQALFGIRAGFTEALCLKLLNARFRRYDAPIPSAGWGRRLLLSGIG